MVQHKMQCFTLVNAYNSYFGCWRIVLHSYSSLRAVSFESGILEDPDTEGPANLYQMTTSPQDAPDKPERIEIEFKKGKSPSIEC